MKLPDNLLRPFQTNVAEKLLDFARTAPSGIRSD